MDEDADLWDLTCHTRIDLGFHHLFHLSPPSERCLRHVSTGWACGFLQLANIPKAVASDNSSARVWKAAGWPGAMLASGTRNAARDSCGAPVALKGGRVQKLCKGKASRRET